MFIKFHNKQIKWRFYRFIYTIRVFIFVWISMSALPDVYAQESDSVKVSVTTDSVKVKKAYPQKTGVGIALNWDARNSFIKDKKVNVFGFNTGIVFGKKRSQITVGYYWMSLNTYQRLLDFSKKNAVTINLDYYTKTDLYYFNLMYWVNLVETRRWRFSIPLEVGVGTTKNQGTGIIDDIQIWKRNDFFIPVQSGLYLKWKFIRWVGVSIQGGYRYALLEKNIQQSYNGFYYSYGLELSPELFQDISRGLFRKNK